MNIIYRKNTLYVYMNENIDKHNLSTMEERINHIMGTYDIDNLVINTYGNDIEGLYEFENRYNSRHKSRVIIK